MGCPKEKRCGGNQWGGFKNNENMNKKKIKDYLEDKNHWGGENAKYKVMWNYNCNDDNKVIRK